MGLFVSGLVTAIIGGWTYLNSIAKDTALTSKDVASIRETIGDVKTVAATQAQHLEKHDDALSLHGERISALEARR